MRTKTGVVVSAKMQKTVVVKTTEYHRHFKYAKDVPFSKKFHAHTEEPIAEGTTVTIRETNPRSKTVCWEVVTTNEEGKIIN